MNSNRILNQIRRKMKTFCFCFAILMVFLAKANCSGEITDMDAKSAELKPITEFAELMLDRASNSVYVYKVGNVLKAQKQIVSGVKYYLTFEFKETTCLKNQPNDGVCDTFTVRYL